MSEGSPGAPGKRRFIAGAVCPSCAEMDKIVAWHEGGVLHRECVRCGFRDRMAEGVAGALPTRVDPGAVAAGSDTDNNDEKESVQPIKFFAPRPPGSTENHS